MEHNKPARKIFFLPLNTGYQTNGLPNKRCRHFYKQRSGNGIYCVIVGNVVIPNGFGSNNVCTKISDSEEWFELARAIKSEGARPGIQLSSSWAKYQGIREFEIVHGRNPISEYKNVIEKKNHQEICDIFDDLFLGAKLAIKTGFQHIQVHAAHGYLFSLLLDPLFSPHSTLAFEKLTKLAKYLRNRKIESSLRFSMKTGDDDADRNREGLINNIFSMPFDFFDASNGFYNIDKRLIYPHEIEELENRYNSTLSLANQFPNKQVLLSGKSSGLWDDTLPNNIHIGVCRDLIANNNLLRDKIKKCNDCMMCHYYSRGKSHLECGVWKTL